MCFVSGVEFGNQIDPAAFPLAVPGVPAGATPAPGIPLSAQYECQMSAASGADPYRKKEKSWILSLTVISWIRSSSESNPISRHLDLDLVRDFHSGFGL